MYQQHKGRGEAAPVRRPGFSTQEWDVIAQEMARRWPNRVFNRYDFNGFTLEDFEDVMDTVIAQGQHKAYTSFSEIRGFLFEAFQRIYKKNGGPPKVEFVPQESEKRSYITWKPEHWEKLLLEYNKLYPGEFSERLQVCTLAKVRFAMEVLPFDLRRKIQDLNRFREQALKYWDGIPQEEKTKHLQDRAIAEFGQTVVVQPVALAMHAASPMASAVHKAFDKIKDKAQQEEENIAPSCGPIELNAKVRQRKPSGTRIVWSEDEWDAIGREMIRQNPHANYLDSLLPNLDLEAVRAAQREVITKNRRRDIHDKERNAKQLRLAFARIKAGKAAPSVTECLEEVAVDVEDFVAQELQQEVVEAAPVEAKVTTAPEVFAPATPVIEAVPASVIHAAASSITSSLAQAATPWIAGLLTEVAKAFIPEITKSLLPELTKTLSAQIADAVGKIKIPAPVIQQVPVPVPVPHVLPNTNQEAFKQGATATLTPAVKTYSVAPVAAYASAFEEPAPKQIKHVIAMAGPQGKQKAELERAYPEFEMIFIENGQGIKRAADKCSLFLCYTKLPQSISQSIKSLVTPDKLAYFDGSVSTMRRVIDGWKEKHKL